MKTGLMKNQGTSSEPRRSNQAGDGADFAFNGQMGDGVNRMVNRYAGNHAGMMMRENYGMGPRKGNASDSSMDIGPSVTRDKRKMTIATASQGGRIDGGTDCEYFVNPDKINVG